MFIIRAISSRVSCCFTFEDIVKMSKKAVAPAKGNCRPKDRFLRVMARLLDNHGIQLPTLT